MEDRKNQHFFRGIICAVSPLTPAFESVWDSDHTRGYSRCDGFARTKRKEIRALGRIAKRRQALFSGLCGPGRRPRALRQGGGQSREYDPLCSGNLRSSWPSRRGAQKISRRSWTQTKIELNR